tara:strand:+ start:6276 stop:6614 length:339 start_codon:yes stop_codon:yes gene_type:complete
MKLYIVKGIEIVDLETDNTIKRLNSFLAYYTNLKEVYTQFDRKTVQSYSSIANKIKETSYYICYNPSYLINGNIVKFEQVRIERVVVNKVYSKYKYLDINPLISQELSDFKF